MPGRGGRLLRSGAGKYRRSVSLAQGFLPLGLAHNVRLLRSVGEGEALRWTDVACDPDGHLGARCAARWKRRFGVF